MEIPDKAPENLSKQPDQGRSPSGEDPPMTMKENVIPDHTRPQGSTVAPSGRDHEYTDISFKSIIRFAVVLVVLALTSHLLLWGVFEIFDARNDAQAAVPNPMAAPRTLPPAPRLQVDEGEDISQFNMQEDSMLQAYGWLDRNAGVARIPIDRAIDVIATKGLPSRSAAAATAPRGNDSTSAADSVAAQGGRNFGPTRAPNNTTGDSDGEGPGDGRRP